MNGTTTFPPPITMETIEFPVAVNRLSMLAAGIGVPVNGCAVMFALFNVWVIARTKILHPNLRLILVVQSALISVFASCEIVIAFVKFSTGTVVKFGPAWLASVDVFANQFVSLLGHLLLVERVMATIWVARYEKFSAPYFSIFWLVLLTTVCGTNSFFYYLAIVETGFVQINAYTLIINYVALMMSFLEIIVIAKLSLYNASKFTQSAFYQKNVRLNSLSERYQLSENVRTMKQLGPTFIAHFVAMLSTNVGLNTWFFPVISLPIVMYSLLIVACSNLAIVISIISFHPELRRRKRRFFRRIRRSLNRWLRKNGVDVNNRVASNQTMSAIQLQHHHLDVPRVKNNNNNINSGRSSRSSSSVPMNTIGTNPLLFPLDKEAAHHFQMLKDAWA